MKKNSPVGIHLPIAVKQLFKERVENLDISASSYVRDLINADLGLPKGNAGEAVAKLILENRLLKLQVSSLKLQSTRTTTVNISVADVEIVDEDEILFLNEIETGEVFDYDN